ncbi:MAG: hypothetical protein ABI681_05465 [Gemmatimonadales bacterium]
MIRNSMLRWTVALLPLVAASQVASAQQVAASAALPPAATLLAKYSSAVGGAAYLKAKAVVTKGGMSMPAAGLNATFEMTQLAPNQMAMITNIPGMGEVQVGFDGTTAWAMDPMQGPRVLSGKEFDQMKDESDRRASVRDPAMFAAVQTVADTTMNSERCYLVKLTWKSGRESFDCYSVSSGLMVAARSTQKTAMGDIPVVTMFNDYKKFGDVLVPTKTVQELMGQQQILTVSSVEFGTGAGITIAPPAAVQALAKPVSK